MQRLAGELPTGREVHALRQRRGQCLELDAAAFDGAVSLGETLVETEEVQRCFAERHLEFALRRRVGDQDACTVDALLEAFNNSGGNLRALVEATATSEAFVRARP